MEFWNNKNKKNLSYDHLYLITQIFTSQIVQKKILFT